MFLVAVESLTAESFVNSMSALLFRKIVEGTEWTATDRRGWKQAADYCSCFKRRLYFQFSGIKVNLFRKFILQILGWRTKRAGI